MRDSRLLRSRAHRQQKANGAGIATGPTLTSAWSQGGTWRPAFRPSSLDGSSAYVARRSRRHPDLFAAGSVAKGVPFLRSVGVQNRGHLVRSLASGRSDAAPQSRAFLPLRCHGSGHDAEAASRRVRIPHAVSEEFGTLEQELKRGLHRHVDWLEHFHSFSGLSTVVMEIHPLSTRQE